MPQIVVEYSEVLESGFDRRNFAIDLHTAAAELIGSAPSSFKTRFYRLDEPIIGDGSSRRAMLHIEFAILSGRDRHTKQGLGVATLDMATRYLRVPDGVEVQTTVEVRDLDAGSYQKKLYPAG